MVPEKEIALKTTQIITLSNNLLTSERKFEFKGSQERKKEDKTKANMPAEHSRDQSEDFEKLSKEIHCKPI